MTRRISHVITDWMLAICYTDFVIAAVVNALNTQIKIENKLHTHYQMEWLSCNCTKTCFFVFILKVNSFWKLQWKFSLLYNGKGDANEMEDGDFPCSGTMTCVHSIRKFHGKWVLLQTNKNQVNLVLWLRKSLIKTRKSQK